MRHLTTCLFACGLLLTVACGDPLTKSEAQHAWPTTNRALVTGQSSAGGNPLTAAKAIGPSFTANCTQGGTMKYTVPITTVLDLDEFNFEVKFDDCESDDIKMNGEIDYSLGLVSDGSTTSFSWGWKGDLDYSGAIEGDCEYKMSGSASVSQGTSLSPVDATVQYSGELCGHKASVLLSTP